MIKEKISNLTLLLQQSIFVLKTQQSLKRDLMERTNVLHKTYINRDIKRYKKEIKLLTNRINKLSRLTVKESLLDPFDYCIDACSLTDKQRLSSDKAFFEAVTHVSEQLRNSPFADTHGWYESNWGIFVAPLNGKEHAARNRRLAYSNIGNPLIAIYDIKKYLQDFNHAQALSCNMRCGSGCVPVLSDMASGKKDERPGFASVCVTQTDQSTTAVNLDRNSHLSQLFIHSPKGPSSEPWVPNLPVNSFNR